MRIWVQSGAVIQVAELMIDLKKIGITRSESGLFAPPSKEERAQLECSSRVRTLAQSP
ncbi:hypothetical protein ACFLVN_02390 [Chloroflexota bacterium]